MLFRSVSQSRYQWPISYAHCEDCFNKELEPYSGMVAYVSSAGRFPEDINERYQTRCRNILRELGISEEQFVNDVDKAIKEENEYWKNQDCTSVSAEDFE